jgi:deoxycytidine triphosphate deaminase
MYLADGDIKSLLPELRFQGPHYAHPFDPHRQIQPCSIDLRVSNVFWRPSRRQRLWSRLNPSRRHVIDLRSSEIHELDALRDWKRVELRESEVVTIRPGQTVMGRIYERFRVPNAFAGKIEGRSSFARLGLGVHCTGDFINPGWHGYMPLQLVNHGPYPIRLTPYLPICQLMLIPLSAEPDRSYGDPDLESKYVNDDGGPSLWWRDARVRSLQRRLGEVNVTLRTQAEVLDIVRFQSPQVILRLQRYTRTRRVETIENSDQLLEGFASRERLLRLLDVVCLTLPALAIGALLGSVFAPFGIWHVILLVVAVASLLIAFASYVRRDAGYLGPAELRIARSRPDAPS